LYKVIGEKEDKKYTKQKNKEAYQCRSSYVHFKGCRSSAPLSTTISHNIQKQACETHFSFSTNFNIQISSQEGIDVISAMISVNHCFYVVK